MRVAACAMVAVAAAIAVAGCAGGGAGGGSSVSAAAVPSGPDSPPATTSLPLQPRGGLAVGGDTTKRVTDTIKAGLTREQTQQIADACSGAVEIVATPGNRCQQVMRRVLLPGLPCTETPFCLAVSQELDPASAEKAVIQITEKATPTGLCGSATEHVCLRLGVPSTVALSTILGSRLSGEPGTTGEASPTAPAGTGPTATAGSSPQTTTANPDDSAPPAASSTELPSPTRAVDASDGAPSS